jgi:DHA1 family inner membrane transport protein
VGIAAGALIGGLLLPGFGVRSTALAGGLLSVAGLAAVLAEPLAARANPARAGHERRRVGYRETKEVRIGCQTG